MKPDIKQRIEQIRRGEVPEGYKKTKAGIMPREWEMSRLNKQFIRQTRKNTDGNTNVLTISAQHGLISQEDFFSKSVAGENKENYYLLHRGDFAYNKSYSNGYPYGAIKTLSLYEKGIVSPLYICFSKTKENKCPEFYTHYFEAGMLNHEIQTFAQEGARNHGLLNIAIEDFFNATIANPPLPEQQKIADILTTQDKVIELKEQLFVQKQQQKKYLMQQLLTGKKRLPGFSGEWDIKPLKKIVEKQKSKNNDFKYQLVLSNSAQHGIISQEQEFDKEIANEERIDGYYIVIPEAFVYNPRISVTAPCGPINMNETGETGIISPLYTVFTVSSSEISQIFLKYYFKSSCWHKYVKSVANYGARHDRISISDGDFFEMPIFLPVDKEEQTAIANVLSTADREIDLLRQSIESEKQKKKALMQLLLTGIVRVPV